VLNRGLVTTGSYVFELQSAPRVTLNRLGVRGGYWGIHAGYGSGSTDLTVSNSTVFANYETGIWLDASNDRATLVGNTLYGIPGGTGDDNQPYGISLNSADNTVANNTAYDHAQTGITTRGARTTVSGNNVYGNRIGIYVSGTGAVVRDNLVHDNIVSGLEVSSGGIRAIGNVVYGQTAVNAVGLTGWYDVELADNVVHTNYTGIYASNGAVVRRNRVYNSTQTGISLGNYYNLVDSNRVYSNRVGIATSY
jgi:parallel beta-helix repeat protein